MGINLNELVGTIMLMIGLYYLKSNILYKLIKIICLTLFTSLLNQYTWCVDVQQIKEEASIGTSM